MRRVRECHDGLFGHELTSRVIRTFHDVHDVLGPGFVASVYRRSLAHELTKRGFRVATGVPAEVRYDGRVVGVFRVHIVVESTLAVELSAAQRLGAADERRLLNHLKAADLDIGLLLHFGARPAFRRVVARRQLPRAVDGRRSPPPGSSLPAVPGPAAARHLVTAARPPASGPRPVPPPAAYPIP